MKVLICHCCDKAHPTRETLTLIGVNMFGQWWNCSCNSTLLEALSDDSAEPILTSAK